MPLLVDEAHRQYHEVANIFPLMTGAEFDGLKADIAEHGQREPVWLHPDGRIIDGRNRHRACVELEIAPQFEVWNGNGSLVAFVVSLNLHRRHLSESQRQIVAAKIANMPNGGDRVSDQSANLHSGHLTAQEASELLNVSRRGMFSAKQVLAQGAPELVAAVERGEVAVSTAADVATLPVPQQREIVARGEREILEAAKQIRAERAEARREERLEKIVEIARGNTPLLTAQRFPVVYADPPWRYEHAVSVSREIENQYPTMSLEEICALPVDDVVTPDAILFLWTTSPKLEESMRVIAAWGFSYRTCFVWVKDKIGMGYYARQRHELLLVAKRGDIPTPPPTSRFDSVIEAPRNEHSEKPDAVYEMIETMYPDLPKIEFFARNRRAGWEAWGNQAND